MRSLLELYKILLYEMIFSKTKFKVISDVKIKMRHNNIITIEEYIKLNRDYDERHLWKNSNFHENYASRINMIYNIVKELRNENKITNI